MTSTIRLHPRHVPVELARRAIDSVVAATAKHHALTEVEVLTILNDMVASKLRAVLRGERDGDAVFTIRRKR